jgi:starvation-inducible DNA-binding protein
MTVAIHAAPDTTRLTVTSTLQQLVSALHALALDAKQAHWNMTGPAFLVLHALTDEIAADTWTWADRIAERVVALGVAVDTQPRTVAGVADQFPTGRITDQEAVADLIGRIGRVAETARGALGKLEQADAVAHELVVEILVGLDMHRWALQAQSR